MVSYQNQASYTADWQPTWKVLGEVLGKNLTCLLGPQHGFYGTVQDNMIETVDSRHKELGIPIFSLYSKTRKPTPEMLSNVDTILVDLQTVGCRVYTFKYTVAACLRAASELGKRVVILDRPNPVSGSVVEGNILDLQVRSFVGEYPMPMRHGLTIGEAALYFNREIKAELEVVEMEGWNPNTDWRSSAREWIPTSPNLPTVESVLLYPGTVIFEGTNVSEGRGTPLPFQLIGAPYVPDEYSFCQRVSSLAGKLSGLKLRPTAFQPTFHKHAGIECRGIEIHVANGIEPVTNTWALSLAILRAAMEFGGQQFAWKQPPYEYDFQTLPMKLILGLSDFERQLTKPDFSPWDDFWWSGISAYISNISNILLYPRKLATPQYR